MSNIEKRIERLEDEAGLRTKRTHFIVVNDFDDDPDAEEKAIDDYCKFQNISREEFSRGKVFITTFCKA